MALVPTEDSHEGYIVKCDGCGDIAEHYDDDTAWDYQTLVTGDDPQADVESCGWERWEDGKDRCTTCMDAAIESGEAARISALERTENHEEAR